jgi:sarcosine oxidase, subunit gamma
MRDAALSAFPVRRGIVHLKPWALVSPSLREAESWADFLAGEGIRMLALAPAEWLLVSEVLDGAALERAVADRARAQEMAAVDVSEAMAGLELRGAAAREVLSMGCALDLDPGHFPMGACTRTRLAQLPVLIECTHGEPRFELYVASSYRAYLTDWLVDAAGPRDGESGL